MGRSLGLVGQSSQENRQLQVQREPLSQGSKWENSRQRCLTLSFSLQMHARAHTHRHTPPKNKEKSPTQS